MLQTIQKLVSLLPSGDSWKLACLLLMMLISAALELIGIGLLPLFVASLTHPEQVLQVPQLSGLFERFQINNFSSLLYFGSALLAVVFVTKNTFVLVYRYIESRYLWNRYQLISSSLFSRYMQAPYTFHLAKNSSIILRNVTEEGRFLVNNVLSAILKLVMNLILITTIIGLLIYADPVITLTIILLVGATGAVVVYYSRNRLTEYGKRANRARGEMIRTVHEGLGALKELKVLMKEAWFTGRFKREAKAFSGLQARYTMIMYSNQPLMETFAVLGMLLIALFLHLRGAGSEQMVALLTVYAAALVRMLPAIREIFRDLNNLSYYSYSVDPIYEDMERLRESESVRQQRAGSDALSNRSAFSDRKDEERADTGDHTLRFSDVTFRYPGSDLNVLEQVGFTIKKGELIGISGATGAGKTTLIDLLLGLLKPDRGVITIHGMELEDYLSQKNEQIGYIPQFIFLMDDTLKRNIALGIPDEQIDEIKLQQAVELAQLKEVVDALPDGLETKTGENGVRFSGGQRQRIGIARALYHQPALLIMDEATSALDSETEMEIINSVVQLKGDLTILMITHRIASMEKCDRIFEIHEKSIRIFEDYDQFRTQLKLDRFHPEA